MECSCVSDYEKVFSRRAAASAAERFRRKGLTGTGRTILSLLTKLGFRGSSVLEIGGGLGEIQVVLLERGLAKTTTNVELATNWEAAADDLVRERGLVDRITRVHGNFVDLAPTISAADLVVLNRVVCCYPEWRELLGLAAARANGSLAVSFPRPWSRSLMWIENLFHRLRGRSFRAFVHPEREMIALLNASGLEITREHNSVVWRTVVLTRDSVSND